MQKNASLIRLDEEWGFETKFGRQILPEQIILMVFTTAS